MGKVGKFLLAAAGVALAFVPGLGEAVIGAIYGGLAGGAVGVGAAAAFTLGETVVTGLAIYGVSTVIGLIGSLFAPSAPRPQAAQSQERSPVAARSFIIGTRRSFGALVLFESANGASIDVIAFMDGRAQAVRKVYLNDSVVTVTGGVVQGLADGSYGDGRVLVGYNLGLATETAFAEVMSRIPSIWTATCRGDGVVSGYLIKTPVGDKNFLKRYPQGDNVQLSLVIDSWPLFDPRGSGGGAALGLLLAVSTGGSVNDWTDDSTWTGPYDNPVLALMWYLVVKRGESYEDRILPAIDYWIDAANICDSQRALKAGGSEKLYRLWLMYDGSAKPNEVVAEILKSFDGFLTEDADGYLRVFAGKLYTPSVAITERHIVDYEVSSFVADEDHVNEVSITYISDQHDYAEVECSSYLDAADIAERGKKVSVTFNPQVPSYAQAQYLARRLAGKTNTGYSGSVSTNFTGQVVIGERYINLTIIEAGATFFDGVAEILEIQRNALGGVTFKWVSVPDTLDDWNPAIDEGYPAPTADHVPLTAIDPPTITEASAIVDSDATARLLVTAEGSGRDDETWYLRWRLDGDTLWTEEEITSFTPGASVELISGTVPVNQSIEVEVGYSLSGTGFSDWSASEVVDTSAAGLAPSLNTAFTASGGAGSVSGSWANSASANFGHSELWYGTTSSFGAASQLGSDFSGVAGATETFSESLASGSYFLWSVAYNAADSAHAVTGPIAVTVT